MLINIEKLADKIAKKVIDIILLNFNLIVAVNKHAKTSLIDTKKNYRLGHRQVGSLKKQVHNKFNIEIPT